MDEDHDILEDLLEEAGFDEGWDFLTEEVDSRDTLIEIILEEDNEDAWLWLDNFVRLECASDTTNYCGGAILDTIPDRPNDQSLGLGEEEKRDAFTAYCKALRSDNNDYETFVESELFERDYEDFVTDLQVCCRSESDANKFDGQDCTLRYSASSIGIVLNEQNEMAYACNKVCTDDADCAGTDTCQVVACPTGCELDSISNPTHCDQSADKTKACSDSTEYKRCKATRISGANNGGYIGKLKFNEAGLKEACKLACFGTDSPGDRCGQ